MFSRIVALLLGHSLCEGLVISLYEVVVLGFIPCVGLRPVNWPRLFVGRNHSVSTYPHGNGIAARTAWDGESERKLDGMESSKSKSDDHFMHGWHETNTRTTWATQCVVWWVSMTTQTQNEPTRRQRAHSLVKRSRFMCLVLVLVFTLSLVSDVLSFGFTTHT